MPKSEILKTYLERYRALPFHHCTELKQMTWEISQWQQQRMQQLYPNLFHGKQQSHIQNFFFSHFYNFNVLEMLAEQITEVHTQKIKLDRWLPSEVLDTILQAFHLALLTLEQDLQLAQGLKAQNLSIKTSHLLKVLESTNQYAARQQQLKLLDIVSTHLNKFAHSFLLRSAFKLARSKLYERGFSALYQYVDEGFSIMRKNKENAQFFTTLVKQEKVFLDYLVTEKPFDLNLYYDVIEKCIKPHPSVSEPITFG